MGIADFCPSTLIDLISQRLVPHGSDRSIACRQRIDRHRYTKKSTSFGAPTDGHAGRSAEMLFNLPRSRTNPVRAPCESGVKRLGDVG